MLKTEMRNEKTIHIDKMDTISIMKIMNEENKNAVLAVEEVIDDIGKACDAVAAAFAKGGRLFYIGAGTSGRLVVMDAAECPPTFGISKDQVVAILAGGINSFMEASESVEDNGETGINDLRAYHLTNQDIVLGISASGGARYVIGALEYAKNAGCTTIGLTCNQNSIIDMIADISICTDTGAEVITGSTRLKAGTAHKLVLNMISTGAMIKSGKVYQNVMINLKPKNEKLTKRMVRIVTTLTSYDESKAVDKLNQFEWDIKKVVEDYEASVTFTN